MLLAAAVTTEEDKRMKSLHRVVSKSLVKEFEEQGIICRFSYTIVYQIQNMWIQSVLCTQTDPPCS